MGQMSPTGAIAPNTKRRTCSVKNALTENDMFWNEQGIIVFPISVSNSIKEVNSSLQVNSWLPDKEILYIFSHFQSETNYICVDGYWTNYYRGQH